MRANAPPRTIIIARIGHGCCPSCRSGQRGDQTVDAGSIRTSGRVPDLPAYLGPRHHGADSTGRSSDLRLRAKLERPSRGSSPQWPISPSLSPNTAAALCRTLTGFPLYPPRANGWNLSMLRIVTHLRRSVQRAQRNQAPRPCKQEKETVTCAAIWGHRRGCSKSYAKPPDGTVTRFRGSGSELRAAEVSGRGQPGTPLARHFSRGEIVTLR
jgi:hypothetical protein